MVKSTNFGVRLDFYLSSFMLPCAFGKLNISNLVLILD